MSICDVPVISEVCDAVGEGAATLVSAPFDWLAQSMGEAAGWLMEIMWSVFDTTTMVDLTNEGYISVYNLLFGIAVMVVVIFFCLQLITGLIKRDPSALSRAALGAAKSILGSFLVLTLMGLLLEIVDQLSIGIIQAAGETTESMGDKIILLTAGLTAINAGVPGVGAIITIFLAGLMIAAIGIVWFSLLIRKALLLVAIVLAPLAFAGAAWDAARGWIGKWIAFVVALALSKLVLVVVFLIAITQMAAPIEADIQAVTEPVTGIVLLGIAAFAPYMVYRFISFLGFDLYNAMGSEQESKQAMNRPVPTPSKPQGEGPKKVLGGENDSKSTSQSSPGSTSGSKSSSPASTAGISGGAGSTGASSSAGAGAGAGAGAAGPIAAGVIGAKLAQKAATAGPQAGKQLGGEAETQADAAGGDQSQSSSSIGQRSPNQPPPPSSQTPGAQNRQSQSPGEQSRGEQSAGEGGQAGRSTSSRPPGPPEPQTPSASPPPPGQDSGGASGPQRSGPKPTSPPRTREPAPPRTDTSTQQSHGTPRSDR